MVQIASLSPAVTEILFKLERGEEIVCTDQFSNFPEEAKEIPHVKDHVKVSYEALMEYEPELVFTCTVIQEKLAEELKSKGLSVVHFDPRKLHEIYDMIRSIGMLFQIEDEAKEIVLSMQQGFNDVKKKAAHFAAPPSLYIEEWPAVANALSGKHDPPYASGNWVPEVARFAGCRQFPVPDGQLSPEVTLEQVKAHDPDLIIISWCGAGSLADPDLLTKREGWDQLRAVKEGNIRVIDDSLLNRPGPRLVEGAQRIFAWCFEMMH